MICPDCVIVGEAEIHNEAVLHPKVSVSAHEGQGVKIGEKTIVEELCCIDSSCVGSECLVEVGTLISSSTIGNSTYIGPKCKITNCTIGNGCVICPAIELENVTLQDNTSVYCVDGQWRCKPVDNSFMKSTVELYREKMLVAMQILAVNK